VSERAELVALPEHEGERLDVLLATLPEVGSRAAAQRLVAAGRVAVDGRPLPKRHRVRAGERIVVELAAGADPAAAVDVPDVAVVHEDEHLLVVDKPAGLVVHPAAGHRGPTLVDALRGRAAGGPDPERPGIVHRLDRDTSGLLVVARSDAVHAALADALRAREVRREYLALVEGRPDALRGTIDAPVGRDRTQRTVVSTRSDRPRSARTHFEQLEALPRTTLLRARLETGRTHQIRVHMAAIGHPVCGDRQYGGAAAGRRLGLTRQFLHSAAVMFRHPATREELRCESKLPADLHRTLGVARREPASGGPDGG
jgi:23S rRNA pseudouridine1911/1915/1917 synthase